MASVMWQPWKEEFCFRKRKSKKNIYVFTYPFFVQDAYWDVRPVVAWGYCHFAATLLPFLV